MAVTVGIREFRQGLADYIDQQEPVTVTRHGRTVGVFIPARQDPRADIATYLALVSQVQTMLKDLGVTEDEIVAEFEQLRRHDTQLGK